MESFSFADSENFVLGGKAKVEKLARGSTVKPLARKRLTDISNLPQRPKILNQVEKPQPDSLFTKEYLDQIHKEKAALMELLADRNKIIELSGLELQKLRINLQRVQQQNLQLAQANSHMLAELNSGKDRLKALHHELGCKNGLIEALKQAKEKTAMCQESANEVGRTMCDEAGESLETDKGNNELCNTNGWQRSEKQSMGPSGKQVKAKEKSENKGRRQSARFKPKDPEPKDEDLFEIDDFQFSISSVSGDVMHENDLGPSDSVVKEEDKEGCNNTSGSGRPELQRSSIGRPLRRAAEKVMSYKEIPLNVKMRRGG